MGRHVVGLRLDIEQRTLSMHLDGSHRVVMVAPGDEGHGWRTGGLVSSPLQWVWGWKVVARCASNANHCRLRHRCIYGGRNTDKTHFGIHVELPDLLNIWKSL